jgi:hypothetical protein
MMIRTLCLRLLLALAMVAPVALSAQRAPLDVTAFGATGNGHQDDTEAIRRALRALPRGGTLHFRKGTYLISATVEIPGDEMTLEGEGPQSTLLCAPTADFQVALLARARWRAAVRALHVDCNRVARMPVLTSRTIGILFDGCTESTLSDCLVEGTVGGGASTGGGARSDRPQVPGVAIGLGGLGKRNLIYRCTVRNGGIPGRASDGIYTSGDFNVIQGCVAEDCLDTAFVLEKSNYGSIVDCKSLRCSAGIAITNTLSSPARGNHASGVEIREWSSKVTGGIQIGNPAEGSLGDLVDTQLSDITMSTTSGQGPAINIRNVGKAKTVGLMLNRITIQGASTQGILINQAVDVTLLHCRISGTDWTPIHVMGASSQISIQQCDITAKTPFAISAADPASSLWIQGNRFHGTAKAAFGVYLFGQVPNATIQKNQLEGFPSGKVGKDTPTLLVTAD